MVKNLPEMQETEFIPGDQIQSLGREDPLQKGILAWKIPWTEEPGELQSKGSQRVGHN